MVVVVTKGCSIDPCDTICASRTVFGIGASKTKGKGMTRLGMLIGP